jgi:hypothetical protein
MDVRYATKGILCIYAFNRGKAIAGLVPSEGQTAKNPAAAIDQFLAFKKSNPVRTKIDIRAAIEEGRE